MGNWIEKIPAWLSSFFAMGQTDFTLLSSLFYEHGGYVVERPKCAIANTSTLLTTLDWLTAAQNLLEFICGYKTLITTLYFCLSDCYRRPLDRIEGPDSGGKIGRGKLILRITIIAFFKPSLTFKLDSLLSISSSTSIFKTFLSVFVTSHVINNWCCFLNCLDIFWSWVHSLLASHLEHVK